jgi:hypothetical protein
MQQPIVLITRLLSLLHSPSLESGENPDKAALPEDIIIYSGVS